MNKNEPFISIEEQWVALSNYKVTAIENTQLITKSIYIPKNRNRELAVVLTYLASGYDVRPNPFHIDEYKTAALPSAVNQKLTKHPLQIFGKQMYAEFPQAVYMKTVEGKTSEIEILKTELDTLEKEKQSKFIYHAKNIASTIVPELTSGFVSGPGLANEFGRGFYCTPDLDEALNYLALDKDSGSRTGQILVFSWNQDEITKLKIRNFEGAEWAKLVKGNIAGDECGTNEGIAYDRKDFWIGPISDNYVEVVECAEPVVGELVLQYVAKSTAGFDYLARNLEAIIVLD